MKTKFIILAAIVLLSAIIYLQINFHFAIQKEAMERFRIEQEIAANHLSEEVESYLYSLTEKSESLISIHGLQPEDLIEIKKKIAVEFDSLKNHYIKSINI